jgi:putative transposase
MSSRKNAICVRQLYTFIEQHKDEYPIEVMCRLLGVARSGYYAWQEDPESDHAREDARLLELIKASHKASHGIYGAPRVFLDLREAGETCSKNRVERLMRIHNIRAVRGYARRWSKTAKLPAPLPNLVQRNFTVTKPNSVWVTDITYIRTWEGWLYLAVVMDLYSRKIVGWSAGPTISRELILDAVLKAVRQRRPKRAIIHSDQGSQYGSDDWKRFCVANHLEPSMSRRGNCYDNAVAESFFSSLKKERIKKRIYNKRSQALEDIADYIDSFYNESRRHSYLGGLSPNEFERTTKRR